MANLNQPSISKEADIVRKMFASIANRYDFLNTLLSAGLDARWRRQASAAVTLPPDSVILDLCTGTGKLAEEMRRRFPEALVIGVDFCPEMLSLARRKNNPSFSLLRADALSLPVKTSSCDLIAVAFGIRNFADLEAGLREIHRCLRPRGSVVLLEFSLPRQGAFATVYRFYLGVIVPFLGERISGVRGAYSYLRDSVGCFVTPNRLSLMMREVGFRTVSYRPLTGGIVAIHTGWNGSGLSTLEGA